MHKLESALKHHGVLGQKWGVRKDRPRGKLGQHLDSMKRERQWHKTLKDVHNMSTSHIVTATRRITLENELKRLSKSKIANAKDKQDYLRRHNMDNQELSRKVTRLRAKDSLHKAVKDASKQQREFGEKVVKIGGSLAVDKYVLKKSISPKDVFDTVKSPNKSIDRTKGDLMKLAMDKASKTAKSKS